MLPTHDRIKHDSVLAWRPGRRFYPADKFSSVLLDAGVHTGAPVLAEVSTFGITGVLVDTAGDEINTYLPLPEDIDLSKRIYVRVHWTSGSVDITDTVTWKVWYKPIVYNVTALAAIGNTGGTALDKVIAPDDVPAATAFAWAVTEEGYLDAGKLPESTEFMLWSIEMDAFDAGLSEAKTILGLELRYTPRKLWGPDGMQHEAKAPIYTAGKTYSN